MTNCQNKNDLSLPFRVLRAARYAFSIIFLLASMKSPLMAQQNAPMNLLNIAPANTNADSFGGPNSIDQAVERALVIDDLHSESNTKQPKKETTKAEQPDALTATAENRDLSLDSLSLGAVNTATEGRPEEKTRNKNGKDATAVAADDMVNQNFEAEGTALVDGVGSEASKNSIFGSATIGRRKISDVGLAAIGVGELGEGQLDSLIWRGTTARDAISLLQRGAVWSQSQAIRQLAYEVVARQSVPPSGANNVAAELVEARLDFLANGGRSGDLATIVSQLPNAEKWATWRRWLAEHYLMIRDDSAACEIVSREITQTLEPFWHKSNVICQAVQGNFGGARFAADILAANGANDPIFFALVDEVLFNKSAGEIDTKSLNSEHIVLMDVANRAIPLEGLSVLPNQMTETVMKLKFLGPDARMVSTFNGLNLGLISHRQAGKLWRNVESSDDGPQFALDRLNKNADALATALAWRAIDADKGPQRLLMVLEALRVQIKAGNGAMMLPLYAELVRDAITDEAVASAMRFDDLDVAPKLAFLLAINQPKDATILNAFGGNGDALRVAKLLNSFDNRVIDLDVLSALEIWHLVPVLDALDFSINQIDWLELVNQGLGSNQSFINLSPVLLRAVTSAAKSRHVAETVLLANWLLHDVPLHQASPSDLASVIDALGQIGQSETAKAFAQEIIKAHLMQRLSKDTPDGTQS